MKIVFWLVVVCSLWVLVACDNRDTVPHPQPSPKATSATQSSGDVADLVAGQTPSYLGITPGISHKDEVLTEWGEPNVIRAYGDYESLHYFDPGVEYFLIKEGIVQVVTSSAPRGWLARDDRPAEWDDFFQILGSPAVITPTLGPVTWVFPEYGVAVSVSRQQFFAPTSFQEYQALWGELPLDYDPFPLIPSVEAVGIRPGETDREQVVQLLGTPDHIVYQDRNTPYWYNVEPDMLGRLDIFFDVDDVVKTMSIQPYYQVPNPLLLEDAVRQYGKPDAIQLLAGMEGQRFETFGLVYLDRGLRVGARCVISTCETIRRDIVVNQKWYFEPTTLTEYQARFSSQDPTYEPAYVQWHGFDE